MARLVGVDLPREKRMEIALTYIFGVGRTRSNEALTATGFSPDKRAKDLTDDATPSANSLAAVGLLRLEAHTGESRYGEHARSILRTLGPLAARHPLAFGNLLWAVELHAVGITEVVITGERDDLVDVARQRFAPLEVLAWGEPGQGPLWEGRSEQGEHGRGYVCRDHVCAAPAHTVEELRAQLELHRPDRV